MHKLKGQPKVHRTTIYSWLKKYSEIYKEIPIEEVYRWWNKQKRKDVTEKIKTRRKRIRDKITNEIVETNHKTRYEISKIINSTDYKEFLELFGYIEIIKRPELFDKLYTNFLHEKKSKREIKYTTLIETENNLFLGISNNNVIYLKLKLKYKLFFRGRRYIWF